MFAGDAVSWIQELASSRVEQDRATSGEKPGGSVDSAKDNPGKHSNIHCSNTFLAGCYDVDKDHADGQGVQGPGAVQGDPDQVHVGEKAFSNMMNQCPIEEETNWDRREEEGVTKNNNKGEVVMKLDRVPGLGMVEFISDIQRKVYCQALPSLGGKENLMGLSRCK